MNECVTQYYIIKKLRDLSGNEQLDYLKKNKSDFLKKVFKYTYDPHMLYKIDEGKYDKTITRRSLLSAIKKEEFDEKDMDKWFEILDNLSKKRSAKDEDVAIVKNFINQFNAEYMRNFFKNMLFKDLRLNMGVKKFQKVWPDFCVEPQVQLAHPYESQVFENGFYSRKFDGKRDYVREGIAYSRSNKPVKPAPVQHIVDSLMEFQDYVIDGELLYFDNEGKEDFQKAISLTASDERLPECDNLYFVIFDMIPKDAFDSKEIFYSFEDEYNIMLSQFEAHDSELGYSVLATKFPRILIARQDKEKETLDKLRKQNGWEGLMYRDGDACYEYKRTKSLLKIKEMQDGEYPLIKLEVGSGKNADRLGTIWINYKGNPTGVGSGLSDRQRIEFWHNKEIIESQEFKNRFKIKVQYFEETMNQDGTLSLRFPVFLCFRNENNEEFTNLKDTGIANYKPLTEEEYKELMDKAKQYDDEVVETV